jgi:tetratricopeptide (TPR) repeat protein
VKNAEKDPLCLYLIAVAYEHMGSHQKALQFYHMALKLDDDIADAHKKRGLYEQELQLWDKSIDDFTAVLRLNPDLYMIYKHRGYSYFMKNMMKETIDDMTEYLKHDSIDRDVYSIRAKAYKATNRPLESYYDFARAGNLAVLNDFDKMTSLLDSVLTAGDTAKVLLYVNGLLETAPYYSGGWAMKLKILHARKHWDAIDENIKEALMTIGSGPDMSDYAYVLTLQAVTFARKGEKDDAVKTLSEAIKVDRKNAWAYLERGKLYLEMGKASKAESDFQQASALGNGEARKLIKK